MDKTTKTILFSALGSFCVLIVTLSVISVCNKVNGYDFEAVKSSESVAETTEAETEPSPQEYKESCQEVDYEEIARNPELYKGKNIKISGEVWQIVEKNGNALYHIYADETDFGYDYNSSVQILHKDAKNNPRILEDDDITVYGEYKGIVSYTTVLGAEKSIPQIYAKYVELSEAEDAES